MEYGEYRNCHEDIVHEHQYAIDPTPNVTGDQPDADRNDPRNGSHGNAEKQGVPEGERQLPEHVLAA